MPDTFLPRGEHEEFRRTMEAEIGKLTAEDNRLNKRVSNLENNNQQITELTISVQKLILKDSLRQRYWTCDLKYL